MDNLSAWIDAKDRFLFLCKIGNEWFSVSLNKGRLVDDINRVSEKYLWAFITDKSQNMFKAFDIDQHMIEIVKKSVEAYQTAYRIRMPIPIPSFV